MRFKYRWLGHFDFLGLQEKPLKHTKNQQITGQRCIVPLLCLVIITIIIPQKTPSHSKIIITTTGVKAMQFMHPSIAGAKREGVKAATLIQPLPACSS